MKCARQRVEYICGELLIRIVKHVGWRAHVIWMECRWERAVCHRVCACGWSQQRHNHMWFGVVVIVVVVVRVSVYVREQRARADHWSSGTTRDRMLWMCWRECAQCAFNSKSFELFCELRGNSICVWVMQAASDLRAWVKWVTDAGRIGRETELPDARCWIKLIRLQ